MPERKLYRKRPKYNVTAVQLDLEFDGFNYEKWKGTQACKPGDWLVNNNGDVYTVDKEYFRDYYQKVSPGVFEKVVAIWAEVAVEKGSIPTKEGSTAYEAGDYLVFGCETKGLSDELLDRYADSCLTIPMVEGSTRSINLATSVSAVLFEAKRQLLHP